MKRILITGMGSYIGTHLKTWLNTMPSEYSVAEADTLKEIDSEIFEGVDAVVHVAGLAHRREKPGDESLYMHVNRDLTVSIAKLAKAKGVSHFIFLSTMSVYGKTTGSVTAETLPDPHSYYGRSKWEAENELSALCDENFHLAVIRPPMVYGAGCRGNYPRLSKLTGKLCVFPEVRNERSMIYIDTLCAAIEKLLRAKADGVFYPQNREYVNTAAMVQMIAKCRGKQLHLIRFPSAMLSLLTERISVFGKLFGTLTYDQTMSRYFDDLPCISFEETIQRTEAGSKEQ